jgi:hypothetical protein
MPGIPQIKYSKRQRNVKKLFLQFKSVEEIAKVEKCSEVTIYKIISKFREYWKKELPQEDLTALKNEHLEILKAGCHKLLETFYEKNDLRYFQAYIRAQERLSKLVGIDSPIKQEIKNIVIPDMIIYEDEDECKSEE